MVMRFGLVALVVSISLSGARAQESCVAQMAQEPDDNGQTACVISIRGPRGLQKLTEMPHGPNDTCSCPAALGNAAVSSADKSRLIQVMNAEKKARAAALPKGTTPRARTQIIVAGTPIKFDCQAQLMDGTCKIFRQDGATQTLMAQFQLDRYNPACSCSVGLDERRLTTYGAEVYAVERDKRPARGQAAITEVENSAVARSSVSVAGAKVTFNCSSKFDKSAEGGPTCTLFNNHKGKKSVFAQFEVPWDSSCTCSMPLQKDNLSEEGRTALDEYQINRALKAKENASAPVPAGKGPGCVPMMMVAADDTDRMNKECALVDPSDDSILSTSAYKENGCSCKGADVAALEAAAASNAKSSGKCEALLLISNSSLGEESGLCVLRDPVSKNVRSSFGRDQGIACSCDKLMKQQSQKPAVAEDQRPVEVNATKTNVTQVPKGAGGKPLGYRLSKGLDCSAYHLGNPASKGVNNLVVCQLFGESVNRVFVAGSNGQCKAGCGDMGAAQLGIKMPGHLVSKGASCSSHYVDVVKQQPLNRVLCRVEAEGMADEYRFVATRKDCQKQCPAQVPSASEKAEEIYEEVAPVKAKAPATIGQ